MDKRKEPIRGGQSWEFPLRINNHFREKTNVTFDIKAVVLSDSASCVLKLIVVKHGDMGRGEWKDEHEFGAHLDLEELPFDRLVDVGSLIKDGWGAHRIIDLVIDRNIALMLEELPDAYFSVTDTVTEPSGLAAEEPRLIFKLKLGRYYEDEVSIPWSYASKYFDNACR